MKQNLKLIKITYLIGIIVDGFWAIALAFPDLFKFVTNTTNLDINMQVRVVFYIASSLMFGWTFLLAWGYRKLIERRFILLLTAFPVVFGIFIGTLISYANGNSIAIIFSVKTLIIMVLMLLSFIRAEKIEKNNQ